jgi:glucose-6-phosphate isomerase/transaldolase/glucose-6-phosphate isomerase
VPATEEELLARLEGSDTTLWPAGNVAADRLGWLESPRQIDREAKELRRWAATIDQETVVLLGMGGSSLGPAVLAAFAESFGEPSGRRLVVCDTTEPATVASAPFEDAFIIVSSKSGTTLEPNVLFDYARTRQRDPKRYCVITDPGTPLARDAAALRVNRVFENRPDIGGRYSVLSYFGMVPAALLGYDLEEMSGRAMEINRLTSVTEGIAMANAALEGRDKATLLCEEKTRSFGLWVEQLLAESTGKSDRGVVPVPTSDHEAGADRHEIPVDVPSPHALGAAFFDFEIRTAIAGHVLGIDPFNEPNVAESKANTNEVLAHFPLPTIDAVTPDDLERYLQDTIRPGDYVSLQAYLPYGSEHQLEAARCAIRDRHSGIAVTAGYGPRFLHSTGQLHKGGPNTVIAVQLVPRSPRPALAIPDKPYGFESLIDAQVIGDAASLESHGRRHITVAVDDPGDLC